jgi:hypothetical protein
VPGGRAQLDQYLTTLAIVGFILLMFGFQAWSASLARQVFESTPRWRNQHAVLLMVSGERRPALRSCSKYGGAATRKTCQFLPCQFLFLGK